MALAIRKVSPYKSRMLSTLVLAFALMLQPMYGLVAGQVARAAPSTSYTAVTPSEVTWSVDRRAPASFTPTSTSIMIGVDSNNAGNDPDWGYNRLEGMKASVGSHNSIKASLYIDPAWETVDNVEVGIWGVSPIGAYTAYPKVAFTNRNGVPEVRAYNTFGSASTPIGDLWVAGTPVEYGNSYAIELAHNPVTNEFEFYVDGTKFHSYSAVKSYGTALPFTGMIFNNHNPGGAGNSYAATWSNLELGSYVNPIVTGENFNTHSGADYHGINVGFNINNDFGTVTSVKVELFKDAELLVANTHNQALLDLINVSGERTLSSPFFVTPGTYTETYWNLGTRTWTAEDRPTRAVVTVAGANGTKTVVLSPLVEPNGWNFGDLVSPALVAGLKSTEPSTGRDITNGATKVNNVRNSWSAVSDAVSYNYEFKKPAGLTTHTRNTTSTQVQGQFHDANSPEGEYAFRVQAVKANGVLGEWSDWSKVTYDKTQPIITVLSPLANTLVGNGLVDVEVRITENGSGVEYVNAHFSNGPSADSPKAALALKPGTTDVYVGQIDTTGMNGVYRLSVSTRDNARNTRSSAVQNIAIDNTAPKININSYQGDKDLGIFREVSFGYNDANKAAYAVFNAEQPNEKIHDFGDAVWSNTDNVWANRSWTGVQEGLNTVTLYDTVGNKTTLNFTIDRAAPSVTKYAYSNNGRLTQDDVTVTITTSEPVDTPADWEAVDDGTTFTKLFNRNGGFTVDLTDLAGNTATVGGKAQGAEVKGIDRNAPTISGVADDAIVNTDVTLTIFDPKYEGFDGFDRLHGLTVNGEEVATTEGSGKTYTYTISGEGSYTAVATDKAGNSTTLTFTIDKTAPVMSGVGYRAITNSITISGVTDTLDAPVSVTLGGTTQTAIVNATTGGWVVTFANLVQDTLYPFEIRSTDNAGNEFVSNYDARTDVVVVARGPGRTTAPPNRTNGGESPNTPQLFTAPIFGSAFQPLPGDDAAQNDNEDENTNETDDNGDVAGVQDQAGTPLEDTGEVLGIMDHKWFGIAWYWYLVILGALVGAWLMLAAAIRRNREEA